MTTENFSNFSVTTLNGGCSDSDLVITVTNGALLPTTTLGEFHVVCEDEIMLVTQRAGHVLTVTRGREGTSAAAHADGETIAAVLTKESLEKFIQRPFVPDVIVPGFQGEAGEDGMFVPGIQGQIGSTGATGSTGAAGATGAMGPPGFQGEPGDDGMFVPGTKGDKGDTGATGAAGADGAAGATGATGAASTVPGPPGAWGTDGEDGLFAPPSTASGTVGASAVEVDEDGSSVVAAADKLDFRHGIDVTNPAGNTARVVVDETELDHDTIGGTPTHASDALTPDTVFAVTAVHAPDLTASGSLDSFGYSSFGPYTDAPTTGTADLRMNRKTGDGGQTAGYAQRFDTSGTAGRVEDCTSSSDRCIGIAEATTFSGNNAEVLIGGICDAIVDTGTATVYGQTVLGVHSSGRLQACTDQQAPVAIAVETSASGSNRAVKVYILPQFYTHEAAHIAHDTLWDAKGDLVSGSGADTAVKTSVGSDGKVLKADSGASGGVSWDTIANLLSNVTSTKHVWYPAYSGAVDSSGGAGENQTGTLPDRRAFHLWADGNADDGSIFNIVVPDDWASGAVSMKIYYEGSTAFNGTTDAWVFKYDYLHVADSADDSAAGTSTSATITPPATYGAADLVIDSARSLGTPAAAGNFIRLYVERRGAVAGDTYTGNIRLLGVMIEYTGNTVSASGSTSGTLTTVKEGGATRSASATTLDFGAGFDVSDSSGVESVTLDASEVSDSPVTQAVGDSAVTGASANFANGAHQHALTRPSFDDLSDVVVSGATAGQHVVFDGSNWVTTSIHPLFGDGSDGTVHLTSAGTTPDPNSGATRSGTTWTLVRDVYATDFTVDNGVTVNVLYRIMCTGTMTNNGTMTNPGGSAVSSGNGTGTRGFHAQGGSGGAGILSGTTTVAGTPGNTMGASGSFVYYGGTGGAGGNGNGGAGATRTAGTMLDTNQRHMAFELVMGVFATSPTSFSGAGVGVSAIGPGAGGGGGGRTTGGTATIAGAGGAGGGIILIAARIIDNSGGTITAPGGNGGNASGGTCVTGGGGGGGGGAVILVYKKLTAGTETAPGGTKGTGLNAASAAADGGSGTVLKVAI